MPSFLRRRLRQAWFLWNAFAFAVLPFAWYFGFIAPALACLVLAHAVGLASTFLPNLSWLGKVHSHFHPTSPDEVWLTIDDGPDPVDTPYLLDLLDQHDAKATFFFIGEKIKMYPHLVMEVLQRGHQIGNHTHTHPETRFWAANPSQIHSEISRCQQAIQAVTGIPADLFRAPVGFKNPWLQAYLERENLPLLGWSCRGFDGSWKDPDAILKQLYRDLQPGAIVLVHESKPLADGQPLCPQVIAPLLEEMKRRNLRCVLPARDQWR